MTPSERSTEWNEADNLPKVDLGPRDRNGFKPEHRIGVLDRHPEAQQLLPRRELSENARLLLRPNTWSIECQRQALWIATTGWQPLARA